jgi:hypothetical protein
VEVFKELLKKKRVWFFCLGLLFFPVLLNFTLFKFDSDVNYVKNDTAWLGFFATYFGALFGGIIAGYLTLLGVQITIKHQRSKEFEDQMPQKLMNLEDIIFFLEQQYGLLKKGLKLTDETKSLHQRLHFTLQGLEDSGLLKKSAQVNLETYIHTRMLYNFLKKFLFPVYDASTNEKEITDNYERCINRLKEQRQKVIEELVQYYYEYDHK